MAAGRLALFLRDRHTTTVRFPTRLLALLLAASPLQSADDYKLGPDSQPQAVPRGEVRTGKFETSKIFPGTTREYFVYVPKQYDAAKPACRCSIRPAVSAAC